MLFKTALKVEKSNILSTKPTYFVRTDIQKKEKTHYKIITVKLIHLSFDSEIKKMVIILNNSFNNKLYTIYFISC